MKDKYIHLIYGDGKGKTSASVGMMIRALGAGYEVCFCQFMKGRDSSEIAVLSRQDNILILRPKKEYPFYRKMTAEQIEEIKAEHESILSEAEKWLNDPGSFKGGRMLVLDELTHALNHGLVDRDRVYGILDGSGVEIVITGRDPEAGLVERSDYISHIVKERHPYDEGLKARKGIEF